MTGLELDDVVQVVAETLANGAPHPFFGRTGVVSEIRSTGQSPVRVHIVGPGGRAVMFSADELRHKVHVDGDTTGESLAEVTTA